MANNDSQRVDQHAKSFDKLRESLNRLSQPFDTLSKNINSLNKDLSKFTESISNLSTQNDNLSTASDRVGNKINNLSSSFTTWGSVIELVRNATSKWMIALTGGLALVTTFLPEIIELIGSFFKGKEAIAQMTDKMKGFNEIMKAATSDTAAQTSKLNFKICT